MYTHTHWAPVQCVNVKPVIRCFIITIGEEKELRVKWLVDHRLLHNQGRIKTFSSTVNWASKVKETFLTRICIRTRSSSCRQQVKLSNVISKSRLHPPLIRITECEEEEEAESESVISHNQLAAVRRRRKRKKKQNKCSDINMWW